MDGPASPEERNIEVRKNMRLLRKQLSVVRDISRKTARDCAHYDIIESLISDTAEAIKNHNKALTTYAEKR